jgi:outer membrane protein OmpA-like peptidoglycan-associated protein
VVNVPKQNAVAVWSYEGKVTIWDTKTKGVLKSYLVSEPDNYSAASFNKDGTKLLTSASGNDAKIWDASTGKLIKSLGGHSRIVRLSRFSPIDDIVATGSYDGTVRIWKKDEPEPLLATNTIKSDTKITTTPKVEIKPKIEPKVEPKKQDSVIKVVAGEPKDTRLKFNDEVVELGKTISLDNIQFEQSSYILLKDSYKELDNLVDFLIKNPTIVIEISGHTDNKGEEKKNYTLSERRVATVTTYLTNKKIDEKRIIAKAFGGTKPIADNNSEMGRQINRRVEMKFLKL